ncbi:hypothetical protein [Zhihengliuella halotolerans]|uniref:hypothetical protein n=1 Tax=Zhihengliuella halotolerans TaxID=370736 RepID=UPI0011AEC8C3|nr:hypothetical protein [Zhihengliuella halotolerans]
MRRLIRESHVFYKLTEYMIDDVADVRIDDAAAIYHLAIGDGMILSFVLRAGGEQHDVLRVALHGARTAKVKLPYFLRVSSSLQGSYPFIAFSDPTLGLDEGNLLSWYLGTPGVDVDDWMERVVRYIASATGASGVVFEGSSGGGYTSLRLSARFAASVALCFSPQTDTFRYLGGVFVERVVRNLFLGCPEWELKARYPGRFSVTDLYGGHRHRGNLVTYAQNDGDAEHLRDHLAPFLEAIGYDHASGESNLENFRLVREHIAEGHGPHPLERWNELFEDSVAWLRRHIARTSPLPPGAEPMYTSEAEVAAPEAPKLELVDESGTEAASGVTLAADGRLALNVRPPGPGGGRSETLVVYFHSVVDPVAHPYPYVDSPLRSERLNEWSVVVPDPTLALDATLRLGWYLGGESWDPLPDLEAALSAAADRVGARRILLVAPSTAALVASRLLGYSNRYLGLFLAPVFALSVDGAAATFVRRALDTAFPSVRSIEDVARSDSRPIWKTLDAERVRVFVNPESPEWKTRGHHHFALINQDRGGSLLAAEVREGLFAGHQTAAQPNQVECILEEWLND